MLPALALALLPAAAPPASEPPPLEPGSSVSIWRLSEARAPSGELETGSPRAGAPSVTLTSAVLDDSRRDAFPRLGRLAPTRFEVQSELPGRVHLLAQMIDPGAPVPAADAGPLPFGRNLALDPNRARLLASGWVAPTDAWSLELPPACALPLGARVVLQACVQPADGGPVELSAPALLEVVDRREWDLARGLVGWNIAPDLSANFETGPVVHLPSSGLRIAPNARVELDRALRGLVPETEVELRVELRGRTDPSTSGAVAGLGEPPVTDGPLPERRLEVHLIAGSDDSAAGLPLVPGAGGLVGTLRARVDAGGRVQCRIVLENGARVLELDALEVSLR